MVDSSKEPLTRNNVSEGNKIMIPVYILAAWFFGIMLIIDPQNRSVKSPIFEFPRAFLPIHYWGTFFIILAILLTVTFFMHDRKHFVFILFAFGTFLLFWSAMLSISTLHSHDALFTIPGWPLVAAISTFASGRSLLRRN